MSFAILRDPSFKWYLLAGIVLFFIIFLLEQLQHRRAERNKGKQTRESRNPDSFE